MRRRIVTIDAAIRRRTMTMIALLQVFAAMAQQNHGSYLLADELQLWRSTENAAGMNIDMKDSADNRGMAAMNYTYSGGSYRRVQQGGQLNMLNLFTERYQKIGNYLYGYGSFAFDMGRRKERAWSDVMPTDASTPANPYISGSSIRGKYDNQDFRLTAKLATVKFRNLSYGAALYYNVADESRLRDPRSRVRLADYKLAPSIVYSSGNSSLGLAAWYHRRKEKLVGLKTVQTDPGLKYYIMTGLEHAEGTVGGYSAYWRENVAHEGGTELSYGYKDDRLNSHTSLSFCKTTEFAYGQYKYEPGRFHVYSYGASTHNRLKTADRLLHSIDLSLNYHEAYADQFSSQLITEKDGPYTTLYWQKDMTYRKRYQAKMLDLEAHYRLSVVDPDGMKAWLGAGYMLQTSATKYLLPTSKADRRSSVFTVEGACGLIDKHLWLKAQADYRLKGRNILDLNNEETDYAQEVLIPDMNYYDANWCKGTLELIYQHPVTLKKVTNNWFAKITGSYLKTDTRQSAGEISASIGLYY